MFCCLEKLSRFICWSNFASCNGTMCSSFNNGIIVVFVVYFLSVVVGMILLRCCVILLYFSFKTITKITFQEWSFVFSISLMLFCCLVLSSMYMFCCIVILYVGKSRWRGSNNNMRCYFNIDSIKLTKC